MEINEHVGVSKRWGWGESGGVMGGGVIQTNLLNTQHNEIIELISILVHWKL